MKYDFLGPSFCCSNFQVAVHTQQWPFDIHCSSHSIFKFTDLYTYHKPVTSENSMAPTTTSWVYEELLDTSEYSEEFLGTPDGLSGAPRYSSRVFRHVVANLWNSLPSSIHICNSLCTCKFKLKTHLFKLAYTDTSHIVVITPTNSFVLYIARYKFY